LLAFSFWQQVFSLSSLESALLQNAPVTPVECALSKHTT
jgi:hypothetical protein